MAVSLAKLLLLAMLTDWMFRKIRLPGFIGILLTGFLLGPQYGDQLAPNLLAVSADLRLIALVVILLRAGFSIHLQHIRHFGYRLLLLVTIPSMLEAVTVACLARLMLSFSWLSAFTLGFILPAVSPAVIIPFMIQCIEEKRGNENQIPQLILTAASLDNILNILICNVLISMYAHHEAGEIFQFAKIPVALVNGLLLGSAIGIVLYNIFESFNPRATKRALTIFGLSLLLIHVERKFGSMIPFSGLLATMAIGCVILTYRERLAHEIASKFGKIWIFAEILLFAVVGADFKPLVAWQAGAAGGLIIVLGVCARSFGVLVALWGNGFTAGETLVVVSAWLPKASVQAAIGAAPLLAMKTNGLPTEPGETILALATLSIMVTAPLGAILAKLAADNWLLVTENTGKDRDKTV